MATQGPLFPGTTASLANAGTSENAEAWVNPGNIVSDNGTEAAITAATYDSPDISQLLVASNFNFNAVSGTINGITVEIDRRSIIASSGKDFRVQLGKGTTFASLVGSNKAVPATIWPTTSGIATYGGAADLWGATWNASDITASSFAVFLSCQANIANADVGVDFIRVTVTYTAATNETLTPTTAALVITPNAPTVSFTAHQTVTPSTLALAATPLAPTVTATNHQLVTPSTGALTTSAFAPTVTASDHQSVTPTTVSLSTATFAPTVTATAGTVAIPGIAELSLSTFAPTVTATAHQTVTPGVASVSIAAFAPTVTATNHQTVVPGVAVLTANLLEPTVTATDHKTLVPSPASLTLTTYIPVIGNGVTVTVPATSLSLSASAPTVSTTQNQLVTPDSAALGLALFAPSVYTPQTFMPTSAALALTTFAPTVSNFTETVGGFPPVAQATSLLPVVSTLGVPGGRAAPLAPE